MSLYNALFGRNPASRFLLAMLGLAEGDVGRFRDCYLCRKDDDPKNDLQIAIYTRNGGGNRSDYEEVTAKLQAHPAYLDDADDDFDCTYATYRFKVPEKFKATADELATLGGVANPAERFKTLIEKLQFGNVDDPDVKRAMEVGQKILAPILETLKMEPPIATDHKGECRCAKCAALCKGKPGWFAAGEATKAAAELGLSLPEFFKQYLSRDYFIEDYEKDNDGDHSTRAWVLSPAWGGSNGKTIGYAHAGVKAPCALLGPTGCRLSAEARPQECRSSYGCRTFEPAKHEVEQRQIFGSFKSNPGELEQLAAAGVLDLTDDGGDRAPVAGTGLLSMLGYGGE